MPRPPSRLGLLLVLSIGTAGLVSAVASPAPDDARPPVAPPETFTPEQRAHWAYQPPKRPGLPDVEETGWVRNPVDHFILAGLEAVEFRHAPEADRVALIRRVTFDL